MAHPRTNIRQAIATILTGTTDAGSRVYATQVAQFWDIPLPAILIYARSEASSPVGRSPKSISRTLRIAVEVRAKADEAMDDALDAIALQVEQAIDAKPTLNGTVQSCALVSTEIDVNPAGEYPLGAIRLTYEVIYEG